MYRADYCARLVIWAFFLLVQTRSVEFFALNGSPVRPVHVYAVLVLLGLTISGWHWLQHCKTVSTSSEILLFAAVALIVVLMIASLGGNHPNYIRVATWPAFNLAMACALFYFCRCMNLWRTIAIAAMAALSIELCGILIDAWFPGTFAQVASRPAGFPQNSNIAAEQICFLLALLLPLRLRDPVRWRTAFAVAASAPFIALTLSKGGAIFYAVVCIACIVAYALSQEPRETQWTKLRTSWVALGVLVVGATASLSPVLNEPWGISTWRSRLNISVPDMLPSTIHNTAVNIANAIRISRPPQVTDQPVFQVKAGETVSQSELDASMRAAENTTELRMGAAKRFLLDAMRNPLVGLGTAYVYDLKVGPHNTLIFLFVEQGASAVALYIAALLLMFAIAVRRRSPMLTALTMVGVGASLVSHTALVEPTFLVFAGGALGATGPTPPSRPAG